MYTVRTLFLYIFLFIGVYEDLVSRKIKNKCNILNTIIGLILSAIISINVFLNSLIAVFLAFIIGIIIWKLGIFAAGDAKFLLGIGAFCGVSQFVNCFLQGIIIGGILAFIILIYKGIFIKKMNKLVFYFRHMLWVKKYQIYQAEEDTKQLLPFALPLALGCISGQFIRLF